MSFSSEVKEELSRQLSPARHCRIAELAALLNVCGQVEISEDDSCAVILHTENISVARKYFTLLKKTFNPCPEKCMSEKEQCLSGRSDFP